MKKEKFWTRDLEPGLKVSSTFLATGSAVRNDSRGAPYMLAKLGDRTGSVDAIMWNLSEDLLGGLSDPAHVQVEGHTHEHRGNLQLKVERLRVLGKEEVEEEDYIPATEQSRRELAAELERVEEELEDGYLRELFALMAADEELWEAFCAAPAAKAMHHARIGGLLEHSAQCLRAARALAELYPVDRDLLLFGAIFHDVGKVRELSWESGGFRYTTEGRLQGHVVLGERLVASYIARIPDFPEELAMRLSHLMLSHQGEIEYGSPEQPKTLEALLVHFIDNLDARAAMYLEATRNVSPESWSHHDNPLRRALYVPANGDAEEEQARRSAE